MTTVSGQKQGHPEIIYIEWERIFLNMTVRDGEEKGLFLIRGRQAVSFRRRRAEGGIIHYALNLAAAGGRSFLENGDWTVACRAASGDYSPLALSEKAACQLADLDRIFRYGEGRLAYTVSFEAITPDDEKMLLVVRSCFMRINRGWKRRSALNESASLPSFFRKSAGFFARMGIRLLYRLIASLTPKNGRHILLMSETRDYIWGNLRAIDEGLKARGLDGKYRILYSFTRSLQDRNILSWLKKTVRIARSDYIFTDDYAPIFGIITPDRRSKLIQVWHAGLGFKAVGYCRFGRKGSPHPQQSYFRRIHMALCGSEALIPVYEEVFGIEPEAILPLGIPRMDRALDPDLSRMHRERFFSDHPALKGRKIILFACTFRGTGQTDAFYDYGRVDFRKLYDFCGENYGVVVKSHPLLKEKPNLSGMADRVIDLSNYRDINDLYHVADILITDYSSACYEFAILNRPVLFYTYDRTLYEVTRGVHRRILDSAPGKVCDSFDQLMTALMTEDFEMDRTRKFAEEQFGGFDGRATDRLIDRVLFGKV